jgi:hypothetical protein
MSAVGAATHTTEFQVTGELVQIGSWRSQTSGLSLPLQSFNKYREYIRRCEGKRDLDNKCRILILKQKGAETNMNLMPPHLNDVHQQLFHFFHITSKLSQSC